MVGGEGVEIGEFVRLRDGQTGKSEGEPGING